MQELLPEQLRQKMEKDSSCMLLDVRQPWEFNICQIKGSTNIPLSQLSEKLDDIPDDVDIITICHHGVRSKQAAYLLMQCGFIRVASLQGGVNAWAQDIEPEMERY